MKYPTKQEVETATKKQLAIWYRFLPSPNDEQIDRFRELGGFTPELSKEIGFER